MRDRLKRIVGSQDFASFVSGLAAAAVVVWVAIAMGWIK